MGSANVDEPPRVCIIGAGPAGLMTLNRFLQLGDSSPEVVCYEKQSTWGGQWNFTWKTGSDEYGEPVHSSMYNNMWINVPKEVFEVPDYTFEEHFGRPTPSFIGAPVFMSFLRGLLNKRDTNVFQHIHYNTVVRNVRYDTDSDQFFVQVDHLPTGKTFCDIFTHVVVSSGIFSTPFLPDVTGIETFRGLVLHSHLVKRLDMFKNKRMLVIGSMNSAEDVAMNGVKYGANHVIISYRTKPRHLRWPPQIEERPMVKRIINNTVEFRDDTKAEVDIIVICTGYINHFPFLEGNLRLEERQTSLFPHHLYKGMVWMRGGNRKLIYTSVQRVVYSLPLLDVQAEWIVKYITDKHSRSVVMETSNEEIYQKLERQQQLIQTVTCKQQVVSFMTDYLQDLADEVVYNLDVSRYRDLLYQVLDSKERDIMTYRDQQYTSIYTGHLSPKPRIPWTQRFDDSVEAFVKQEEKLNDTTIDPAKNSVVMKTSSEEIYQKLERQQHLIQTVTCKQQVVSFMTDYLQDLADEVGYKLDVSRYRDLLYQVLDSKERDIMTYRDQQYTSIYTGVLSPKPKTPWTKRFDDGVEAFVKQEEEKSTHRRIVLIAIAARPL